MRNRKWIIAAAVCLSFVMVLRIVASNGIRWGVTAVLSRELGVKTELGTAHLSLSKHRIMLRDLRIMQPKGFGTGILLNAPLIEVNFDLQALKQKKIHIYQMNLQISDVVVVKNWDGVLNVDQMKSFQAGNANDGATGKAQNTQKPKDVFTLDRMKLSINRVVFKDLTGEKPKVTARYLKIKDAEFTDIASPAQLAVIAFGQSLTAISIKSALIYGAAAATGVGLIPAAAAMVLSADANAEGEYDLKAGQLFDAARKAALLLGVVNHADPKKLNISASIDGNDTDIQISESKSKRTKVVVTSRKLLVPASAVAAGTLYMIEEQAG